MKTSRIDIFSLNPVDDITYMQDIVNVSSQKTIYWDHIKQLFRSFFSKARITKASILVYGVTANNHRTLAPIIKDINSDYLYIDSDRGFYISRYMLVSFLYIIPLLRSYFKANDINRNKIRNNFARYLLTYGKYYVAGKILKRVNPKLLVLANDHTNMNRCLMSQASEKGIKTLYVQHASVTSQFPPLDFDYSFLDGEKQFELYKKMSKTDSLVILSGPCRYDYMSEYLNNNPKYIGISLNEFDEFEKVKKLCNYLKTLSVDYIKVRPHPSMGEWNKQWFDSNGISFSTPSIESPGQYLGSLKLQISNTSGIHLDATLLHVPSIQVQLSELDQEDIFGFVSEGLVMKVDSYQRIKDIIMNPLIALPKDEVVRRFVSSYKSEIEFKVGLFIASCCDYITSNNTKGLITSMHEHGIAYYRF